MIGNKKERWLELCEQAAVEQDPEKLLELTREINRLLQEKECRLKQDNSFRRSSSNESAMAFFSERMPECAPKGLTPADIIGEAIYQQQRFRVGN
jgi:hypothetical protein